MKYTAAEWAEQERRWKELLADPALLKTPNFCDVIVRPIRAIVQQATIETRNEDFIGGHNHD